MLFEIVIWCLVCFESFEKLDDRIQERATDKFLTSSKISRQRILTFWLLERSLGRGPGPSRFEGMLPCCSLGQNMDWTYIVF